MSEIELKRCPFCGGKAEQYYCSSGRYILGCDNDDCPVYPSTEPMNTFEEAAEAWNRRAES